MRSCSAKFARSSGDGRAPRRRDTQLCSPVSTLVARTTPEAAAPLTRARPLLGTLVEVRVHGCTKAMAEASVAAAFACVARVHALMSPYERTSDVARINRAPLGRTVRVHAWTWRVLKAAAKLSAQSGGVFDVTASARAAEGGDWRDIALLSRGRVRRRRDARIDLGGIAKGFAVDQAVAALRARGIKRGSVNAGGDLRVFGGVVEQIAVRHPADPMTTLPLAAIAEGALATSANYLDPRGAGRLRRLDGARLWVGRGSVSVYAPCCMLADALTKLVAAIGPRRAMPLLQRHRATALILSPRGKVTLTALAEASDAA